MRADPTPVELEAELDSMHERLAAAEKSFGEVWDRLKHREALLIEADSLLGIIQHRESRGLSEQTQRDLTDLRARLYRIGR